MAARNANDDVESGIVVQNNRAISELRVDVIKNRYAIAGLAVLEFVQISLNPTVISAVAPAVSVISTAIHILLARV